MELKELERKIDIDNIGSNNKRKYEEIQTKKKKGEYRESENLIRKIFNDNGFKEFEGEWLKPEEIEEIKSARIGLKNNFQSYDPYEFEEFVAKLFSEMGYEVEVTQKSADYGIDVVAEKPDRTVGVQVKQYSEDNPVGNKEVQNTLGSKYSVNADHTILVTTSYFTDYAIKQAKEAPIELWDKNKLHEMVKEHLMPKK